MLTLRLVAIMPAMPLPLRHSAPRYFAAYATRRYDTCRQYAAAPLRHIDVASAIRDVARHDPRITRFDMLFTHYFHAAVDFFTI